jgi:integrase
VAGKFKDGLALVDGVWMVKFKVQRKPPPGAPPGAKPTYIHVHRSTGTASKAVAVAIKKQLKDEALKAAAGIPTVAGAPTLREALGRWLEDHRNTRSKSHRNNVRWAIEGHFAHLLDTRLPDLTTSAVESALAAFLEKQNHLGRQNTPGGRNALLRALNCVVGWAIHLGQIQARPYRSKMERVQEQPRPHLPTTKLRAFLEHLQEHAPPHAFGIAALMAGTGARESEARHARIELVDLKARAFTPWDPVVGTKGKEAKPIALPDWMLPLLKAWIGQRREGLLFPSKRGGPHPRGWTRPYVQAAGAAVGLPGLTPHRLRATFATLLSEAGTPERAIGEALRHKDGRTTRRYLVPNLELARDGANRVAEASGLGGIQVAKKKSERR